MENLLRLSGTSATHAKPVIGEALFCMEQINAK